MEYVILLGFIVIAGLALVHHFGNEVVLQGSVVTSGFSDVLKDPFPTVFSTKTDSDINANQGPRERRAGRKGPRRKSSWVSPVSRDAGL